jgi:hypothetical protein
MSKKLTREPNRMSEQNLATILDSIEALYREHNRHGEYPIEYRQPFRSSCARRDIVNYNVCY